VGEDEVGQGTFKVPKRIRQRVNLNSRGSKTGLRSTLGNWGLKEKGQQSSSFASLFTMSQFQNTPNEEKKSKVAGSEVEEGPRYDGPSKSSRTRKVVLCYSPTQGGATSWVFCQSWPSNPHGINPIGGRPVFTPTSGKSGFI